MFLSFGEIKNALENAMYVAVSCLAFVNDVTLTISISKISLIGTGGDLNTLSQNEMSSLIGVRQLQGVSRKLSSAIQDRASLNSARQCSLRS